MIIRLLEREDNMAERRMFAKTIIDSDAFLEMPISARLLYYDLSMRADDDGFVNSPKKIMKFIGATNDDMNILIARKFVIAFDNGVVVIKHWRIHNYIQNDRYKETNYKEQKAMLMLDENKAYKMLDNQQCIQNVSTMDTQVRLGKDSIGKVSNIEDTNVPQTTTKKRFVKPSITEIEEYIKDNGYEVNAQHFNDYYEANGWKVGKNPMKDWKATLRNWARNNKNWNSKSTNKMPDFININNQPSKDEEVEMPF